MMMIEAINNKHKKVLKQVFQDPVLAHIKWREVENLLVALGAEIEEAAGSRMTVSLNDHVAVFHRPHPKKEIDKGAVKSIRRFLSTSGVTV